MKIKLKKKMGKQEERFIIIMNNKAFLEKKWRPKEAIVLGAYIPF